jgi:hypothetical protein
LIVGAPVVKVVARHGTLRLRYAWNANGLHDLAFGEGIRLEPNGLGTAGIPMY